MLNRIRAAALPLRPAVLIVLFLFNSVLCAQEAANPVGVDASGYRLGPGDRVHITVFKQVDLTGEYVLDGDGRFSFPLIGVITARDITPVELEALLISKLKPDYLVNPRISIEMRNYRPYYLIGEVQTTGSFAYVQGITYLTAIAMAGGYSYRAKKDVVYVIRGNDPEQEEMKLDVNERVRPGDIIRVAERMF